MWMRCACSALAVLAALAAPALTVQPDASNQVPRMVGQCERPAPRGSALEGCFWNASINLGPTAGHLYWHIDRYPDLAAAEAARTLYGRVTLSLGGQILLQTVSDNPGWRPAGGEHLGTVGPLTVPSGIDVTARLMEATASGRAVDEAHVHPGPEAFFLLDGSICLETQAGSATGEGGESMILPARVPMQLASSRDARTRALLLVIHPTGEQWIDRQPSWTPTGGCY